MMILALSALLLLVDGPEWAMAFLALVLLGRPR